MGQISWEVAAGSKKRKAAVLKQTKKYARCTMATNSRSLSIMIDRKPWITSELILTI